MRSTIDPSAGRLAQRGFSLVELMIASAIGSLLCAMAVSLWMAGTQMMRSAEALIQLQDQGQLALDLLGREIRQAGFSHAVNLGQVRLHAPLPYAVLGCEGSVFGPGLPATVYPDMPARPPCAAAVSGNPSDALLVLYESGEPAGLMAGGRGEWYQADTARAYGASCQGNRLPLVSHGSTGAPAWLAANADPASAVPAETRVVLALAQHHYYVDTTPRRGLSGGRLMCAGVGRGGEAESPQPLIQGVMDMRLSYGLDLDGDDAVDVYKSAAQVLPEEWGRLASVRVCLLLRGEIRAAALPGHQPLDCRGGRVTAETNRAGYLHGSFTATYALRNRPARPM